MDEDAQFGDLTEEKRDLAEELESELEDLAWRLSVARGRFG